MSSMKWTSSSLIKVIDREYSNFLTMILRSNKLTKEEKNRMIDKLLENVKIIHNNCFSGTDRDQWKFKKEK